MRISSVIFLELDIQGAVQRGHSHVPSVSKLVQGQHL